jgi:hypothetical protein
MPKIKSRAREPSATVVAKPRGLEKWLYTTLYFTSPGRRYFVCWG